MFCILTFPESEQAASVQDVGNIGCVAGKIKDREELPVPIAVDCTHAKPLDPLLEHPAVVANSDREHLGATVRSPQCLLTLFYRFHNTENKMID